MKKSLSGGRDSEVQVHAVFVDYDGTVSPINVPKSQSKVTPENLSILNQIKTSIPVAVISTKDLAFITKRTPFAHAWAGFRRFRNKNRQRHHQSTLPAETVPSLGDRNYLRKIFLWERLDS